MLTQNLTLIAHRGYSAIAPENTLAAFRAALEAGAKGIEFDVQLSRDRIPVIIHDHTLDRTTNKQGKVNSLNLEQLQQLDAGSWFSPEFAHEMLPTFTEALNLLQNQSITIYPELKADDNWTQSDLEGLIEIILSQGWQNNCVILCFNAQILSQLRKLNQQLVLGFNLANIANFEQIIQEAIPLKPVILSIEHNLLLNNPQIIPQSHQHGLEIITWTVDDLEKLQQLQTLEINTIITNSLITNH